MNTHELKTDPAHFNELVRRRKTFEMRRDDRGFQVGDLLLLKETVFSSDQMKSDPEAFPLRYTGSALLKSVSHIMRGPTLGLAEGWAVMSLSDPTRPNR